MSNNVYLVHHGIKGQKWGVRRFQNKDGSLTPVGKQRRKMSNPFEDIRNSQILRISTDDDLELYDAADKFIKTASKRRVKKVMNSPEMKASRDRLKSYISEDNRLMEQYESVWEKVFNDRLTEDQARKESDQIKKRRSELREKIKNEDVFIKSMFE